MNPESHIIKTALLSVSDKTGIVDLAKELHSLGIQLISTGGTATLLLDAGLPVTKVKDITGFPEIMLFTATPSSFKSKSLHSTGAHLLPKLRC